MRVETYAHIQSKLMRNLADHCHDKALECATPEASAKWIILMDNCLWAATDEGSTDPIIGMLKGAQP